MTQGRLLAEVNSKNEIRILLAAAGGILLLLILLQFGIMIKNDREVSYEADPLI